jgi:hypothetical protein
MKISLTNHSYLTTALLCTPNYKTIFLKFNSETLQLDYRNETVLALLF